MNAKQFIFFPWFWEIFTLLHKGLIGTDEKDGFRYYFDICISLWQESKMSNKKII
jgi:hypothetical protein